MDAGLCAVTKCSSFTYISARLSHMDAGVSQRVLRCRVWAAEPYAAQQSYLYADLSML